MRRCGPVLREHRHQSRLRRHRPRLWPADAYRLSVAGRRRWCRGYARRSERHERRHQRRELLARRNAVLGCGSRRRRGRSSAGPGRAPRRFRLRQRVSRVRSCYLTPATRISPWTTSSSPRPRGRPSSPSRSRCCGSPGTVSQRRTCEASGRPSQSAATKSTSSTTGWVCRTKHWRAPGCRPASSLTSPPGSSPS